VAQEYETSVVSFSGGKPRIAIGKDMLSVNADEVLVTAVKPAEDGKGIIVRLYETKGRSVPLALKGPLAQGKRKAVNFLEHDAGPLPEKLEPHEVVTVRLEK
jgi:alpha-mannosidase